MFHKIQFKTVFYVALVSLLPLFLKTIWDYKQGKESVEAKIYAQLQAIREIKKQQLEDYFEQLHEQIRFFSNKELIIQATTSFQESFAKISPKDTSTQMKEELRNFYQKNYFEQLRKLQIQPNFEELLPSDHAANFLQYHYLVNPKKPFSHPYRQSCQQFDSAIQDLVETFEYKNLFLVDQQTGSIVYSTKKSYEFGTNLFIGTYANSNLAKLFRLVRYSEKDKTQLIDYEFFMPDIMQPAFFIATNIVKDKQIIGTLIIEISVQKINEVMTSKGKWNTIGLGKTGEVYAVGNDFLMRNNSRFFVEDKRSFMKTLDQKQQLLANDHQSNILISKAKTYAVEQALLGKTDFGIVVDYRGKEVLSSYSPLAINGLNWVILAEIDKEEAFLSMDTLIRDSIITFCIIFLLLLSVLVLVVRKITRPLEKLVEASKKIAAGDYKVQIDSKSTDEIGILSQNFNKMAYHVFLSVQNLNNQNEELEIQKDLLEKQARFLEESNQRLADLYHRIDDQKQFMQLIADQTPALIVVKNKEGNYTFVNQVACKILGMTNKEILERKTIQDDFLIDNQEVKWVIENQQLTHKEKKLLCHNEYHYFIYSKIPIRHNKENECLIVAVDITAAKKAEFLLQEKVEALELAQKELHQNNEELFLVNENLKITQHRIQKLLEREQRGKGIVEKAYEKMKNTQVQLVESEKMASLGQLVAGIAHEINNPLNFILGGIQSLQLVQGDFFELLEAHERYFLAEEKTALHKQLLQLRKDIDFEECKNDMSLLVEDIIKGANRATEIVKSLRIFSRMDSEDPFFADIHQLLDSTLIILKNQYKDNIKIIKDYDKNLPQIACYPGKLSQVFMNLIANAIQAIEKEGTVRIQTGTLNNKELFVRISDSGAGIPEKILNRIFEPFFTTKEVGKGTGLGLSISHGIVQKHKGKIEVFSQLGQGTTFQIILPNEL